MSCRKWTRRIVTLSVAAGTHEDYEFTTVPLADPLLTITNGSTAGSVGVYLSADGEAFAPVPGSFVTLAADEGLLLVQLPRSAATVRLESESGAEGVMVLVEETTS
ncbi:MAG: hypothetical protein OXF01_08905 [Gemmatimonadetes bacterium]|nr:hypothetical protein [Gemmatimonadota bacterium]